MTGPEHYRKAEELAAKAGAYLGQGDGQDSAAVWGAVAQVHATLALAAAMAMNDAKNGVPGKDWDEWRRAVRVEPASGRPAVTA